MLVGNQSYLNHWYRRLTPLIDSVLMILGLAMVFTLGKAIFTAPWFLEKMALLIAYIGFGIIALRPTRQMSSKRLCLILALISAAGMFHAALTKQSIIQTLLT